MKTNPIRLQYGTTGLDLPVPGGVDATVVEPRPTAGLPNEEAAFTAAVRRPRDSAPLREVAAPGDRVAVVIPDITRPFPAERVLTWFLAECPHLADADITLIVGTGSHRANTAEELVRMLGPELPRRCRVVNHDAHDPATLVPVGRDVGGEPVCLNRDYVAADRRIIMGFVEPHFMAGFSGGYKAVFPGLADIASIMRYHGADLIGDPRSTWGRIDDNPTQARLRRNGSLLPIDFCINVTLNRRHESTGFFCGAVDAAHAAACREVRASSMIACTRRYPLVVTTNGGYPLDQNLYQAVKGMSAAAELVEPGGTILCAARCNDGFPAHGNFKTLLFDHDTPAALLAAIHRPGFAVFDQWEAQILAGLCLKARIALYSELPPRDVARAYLHPVRNLQAFLADTLATLPAGNPMAILPEGPMTIPYLAPGRISVCVQPP